MKKTVTKSLTGSVPRSDSLLLRLQQAPGQEGEPYLDQLMVFLAGPPANSGDRWIKGAEMCAAWGVPTSHTSVWRLYHSYGVEWRARLALETRMDDTIKPEVLEQTAAQMVAQRTCEILTNPESSHESLISLARIELRKRRWNSPAKSMRTTYAPRWRRLFPSFGTRRVLISRLS